MTVAVVFPHQLYHPHPAIDRAKRVLLIEEPLFFGDAEYPLKLHKQKLMLHRATMRKFAAKLKQAGHPVDYVAYADADLHTVCQRLKREKVQTITCLDPSDDWLTRRLRQAATAAGIELQLLANPGFFNTSQQNQEFFGNKRRYSMQRFYEQQRKRLGILLENDERPVGGKWSYDSDNREKLPKQEYDTIPSLPKVPGDEFVREAREYVQTHFAGNPGADAPFFYPTDHAAAEAWLQDFLEHRFARFGPYEDAMVQTEAFLFHSVLTPMLNIGLLTPQQVVEAALKYAEENEVPLPSLEGFVRQIIGWREFMRAAYEGLGQGMRTSNHWQHEHNMPTSCYDASTGILPVDTVIRRVLQTGYCHHIERLMVLGNFFFLCEIHPRAVYDWFMELFIDSYDWVMVPNVYGMSQHADGGSITTKPYFSGSNYLRKMSDFPAGEWCEVWDGLYWRFVLKHTNTLRRNPRWAMMVRTAEKMPAEKQQRLQSAAEDFLAQLHS